jgi:hypothetical protein
MYHFASMRASVFDKSARYVRTVQWPRVENMLWLRNGSVIGGGNFVSGAPGEFRLHLIGTDGGVRLRFGQETRVEGVSVADRGSAGVHLIEGATKGEFWSADRDLRLRLQRWNDRGQLLRTIEPDFSWFPRRTERLRPPSLERPLPPMVSGVALSSDGTVVFALVHVPDRRWKTALEAFRPPAEQPLERVVPNAPPMLRISDPNRYFDTRIVAFNAATGAVLAERVVDRVLGHAADRDRVLTFTSAIDGLEYLGMMRLVLESTRP